jgi:UDP-glucose 4-epimerase
MKERVAVTGGLGFIGGHLAKRLCEIGHEVIIVDCEYLDVNPFVKSYLESGRIQLVKEDLCCFQEFESVFEGVDVVFHCAANSDTRRAAKEFDVDLRAGIQSTWNVIEAVEKYNVPEVIFTSSQHVYGELEKGEEDKSLMIQESRRKKPISKYGVSKASSEVVIEASCLRSGVNARVVRMTNIVGGGQNFGVLPDFLRKLDGDSSRLEILGDGTQKRNFVFIDDCINALLTVWAEKKEGFNVYNVANESALTIERLANVVIQELNLGNVELCFSEERHGWKGDLPYLMSDIDKLKKTGWEPKYSSEEAIIMAIRQMRG